ncbi:MAG: diaminopimelate epimerase [Acidimicrobiales bacterium]
MLALVKYHGLGNDFLIALDCDALDGAAAVLAGRVQNGKEASSGPGASGDLVGSLARALCDRHTGVGADGLLVLMPAGPAADVRMELRNADGGRAETSGNGLRCFALAAIEAGLVTGPEVRVETDAGVRRAELRAHLGSGCADVSVEMGIVRAARSDPIADAALPGSRALPWPAWSVDAGNPHLVLLAPSLGGIVLGVIGPELEQRRPGGQNVEIVTYDPAKSELSLLVWERGAGVTLACGSGSVAAAAALHSAGIAPARVHVRNPGGTAEVSLSGDDPLATVAELVGPVHRVARIEVDPGELCESTRGVPAS